MIYLESIEGEAESTEVKRMIERHLEYTGSDVARRVLESWSEMVPKFVKVVPKDYKRMLEAMQLVQAAGLTGDEAIMSAFENNKNDLARVSGN
jgi:glutamate synthase (NADPH/NADH) large chain